MITDKGIEIPDDSVVMTAPVCCVFRLWEDRLERLKKFVDLNAPQQLIDDAERLVKQAREAIRIRAAEGKEQNHLAQNH